MDSRADLILRSPLGRGFLVGFLGHAFELRLFEELRLGDVPGTARLVQLGSRRSRPLGRERAWTDVPADEVRDLVRRAVEQGEWHDLAFVDELDLLSCLAGSTFSFGFGGGDGAVWGLTAHAMDELRPLAEALVDSPGARRWWDDVDRSDQRLLQWDGERLFVGADVGLWVRETMAAERADNERGRRSAVPEHKRERDKRRNIRHGAHWWSAPGFAMETWTVGAVTGVPTIQLGNFVDCFAPLDASAATVWTIGVSPDARVLEIKAPQDWKQLVQRFPRDVTGTNDGEWRDWGGVPGPWRLPDWEQAMEHYDGVHVTIGGYVSSCGLALEVDGGYTMLTGWVPDATLWLRDVTAGVRRLGRWHGRPGVGPGDWSTVIECWAPDAEQTGDR